MGRGVVAMFMVPIYTGLVARISVALGRSGAQLLAAVLLDTASD